MDWKCKKKLNVFCLLTNACAVYVIVSAVAAAATTNSSSANDHVSLAEDVRTTPVAQASTSEAATADGDADSSNCFRHMHENAWTKVAVYDSWAAAVNVFVNHSGPHVLTCLHGKTILNIGIHFWAFVS